MYQQTFLRTYQAYVISLWIRICDKNLKLKSPKTFNVQVSKTVIAKEHKVQLPWPGKQGH